VSRALLINLEEGEVVAKCLSEKVGISTIERLESGGVRLVCNSSEGAGTMTRKFKGHLIQGEVVRERLRPAKRFW
jgi:hypothetical protein